MPDYALAPSPDGTTLILHTANCPTVRRQAAQGEMVMTLFGCDGPPPPDLPQHTCLIGTTRWFRQPNPPKPGNNR